MSYLTFSRTDSKTQPIETFCLDGDHSILLRIELFGLRGRGRPAGGVYFRLVWWERWFSCIWYWSKGLILLFDNSIVPCRLSPISFLNSRAQSRMMMIKLLKLGFNTHALETIFVYVYASDNYYSLSVLYQPPADHCNKSDKGTND